MVEEDSDKKIEGILRKEIENNLELRSLMIKSQWSASVFMTMGTRIMLGMGYAMLGFIIPDSNNGELSYVLSDTLMLTGLGVGALAYIFSELHLHNPVHSRFYKELSKLEADITLNTEKYITDD